MQIFILKEYFNFKNLKIKFKIKNKIIESLLLSFLLIISVFPDVVFNGASFRITDQVIGGGVGENPRNFYPVFSTAGWSGSYNDNGGALFQSEPMMDFVRNSLLSGQSPYWNPYSGIGSLGPETLVDQKFSLFTILYSISWGGSGAYNVIMICLYFSSVFFICLIIRQLFDLSIYTAIGVSTFYLLNGYSTANFGSNISQNYLYLPMCLYAGFILFNKITVLRFIGFVFALAAFFSCTFIPTEITSIIALIAILLGYLISKIHQGEINCKELKQIFLILLLAALSAIALLAFIYLPIIVNILEVGEIDSYAKRIFYPINFPQAILSLFSPSHFYQSYNAMESRALFWNDGITKNGIAGNTVYHLGVVSILLAGCAIGRFKSKYLFLLIFSVMCLSLGFMRLFNPEFVDVVFSKIPIIGNIGSQYWWPMVVVPMCVLIAFGIENLICKNFRVFLPIILAIVGFTTILYINKIFGVQAPFFYYKKISIALIIIIIAVAIYLIIRQNSNRNNHAKYLIPIIIIMLFFELIYDSKQIRMSRHNIYTNDPSITEFLKNNSGINRTLSIGSGGVYPELGSALGIQEATTFNFGTAAEYIDYFKKMLNLGDSTQMFYGASLMMMQDTPELHKIDWVRLNLLGIKYIVTPSQYINYDKYLLGQGMKLIYKSAYTNVYLNPNMFPRVFITDLYKESGNGEVLLDVGNLSNTNLKGAKIQRYENTLVNISGETDFGGILIMTDGWNKNWKTFVNGEPAQLLKVNSIFRGALIPKGSFSLVMKYDSSVIKISYLISTVTLLILILLGIFRHRLPIIGSEKKHNSTATI